MLKRGKFVLRMFNVEHIFYFFEIWARHRLQDVPRLPREKISARLNFAAPVPIFATFTRQKAEVPCLKFWARVPIVFNYVTNLGRCNCGTYFITFHCACA
jgi:hypothetical protein